MPMSAIKTYLILNFKSGAYLFEFSFSDDEVGNQNGCACDKPWNGVNHKEHIIGVECLEYREEPDDSEHNRTEDCEDCREEWMSDSSERTAADFVWTCHKLKEHNNRHSDDCVLDNGGVGCEEGDEKSASEHEYNAHTACENTAEKHTKSKHLFASVKLKDLMLVACYLHYLIHSSTMLELH